MNQNNMNTFLLLISAIISGLMVFVIENISELYMEKICGLTKQFIQIDTQGRKIDVKFFDFRSTILSCLEICSSLSKFLSFSVWDMNSII